MNEGPAVSRLRALMTKTFRSSPASCFLFPLLHSMRRNIVIPADARLVGRSRVTQRGGGA